TCPRVLFEIAIIAKYPILRERIKCASPLWTLHSLFSIPTRGYILISKISDLDTSRNYLHAITLLLVLLGFELSLVA
ncbi:MAG: hypothetical protein ACTSUO_08325, partial [Candidatus Thorarchaeota archaeon]